MIDPTFEQFWLDKGMRMGLEKAIEIVKNWRLEFGSFEDIIESLEKEHDKIPDWSGK